MFSPNKPNSTLWFFKAFPIFLQLWDPSGIQRLLLLIHYPDLSVLLSLSFCTHGACQWTHHRFTWLRVASVYKGASWQWCGRNFRKFSKEECEQETRPSDLTSSPMWSPREEQTPLSTAYCLLVCTPHTPILDMVYGGTNFPSVHLSESSPSWVWVDHTLPARSLNKCHFCSSRAC